MKITCIHCDSLLTVSDVNPPKTCPDCGARLSYPSAKLKDGFSDYTLLVRDGHEACNLTFYDVTDLKQAIAARLSPSELRAGIQDRLLNFNKNRAKDSYVENKYRNITVCAYLAD